MRDPADATLELEIYDDDASTTTMVRTSADDLLGPCLAVYLYPCCL